MPHVLKALKLLKKIILFNSLKVVLNLNLILSKVYSFKQYNDKLNSDKRRHDFDITLRFSTTPVMKKMRIDHLQFISLPL